MQSHLSLTNFLAYPPVSLLPYTLWPDVIVWRSSGYERAFLQVSLGMMQCSPVHRSVSKAFIYSHYDSRLVGS
jgi:hypothetical protein